MRFGIVGTNWITESFLKAGRTIDGFAAAAVCSRTAERAEAYADVQGIPHRFASPAEMAASGEIDAVYIASPNASHAGQAILFLEAGIPVLCEKPLASNAAEASAMIEASRRSGALLMEAMKTTFLPNFDAIREHLGRIGKVRRAQVSYNQYSSRYDAYRAGVVMNAFDPKLSNGALMDLGVYCIYPLIRLFGPPQSVKANGVLLESGADGEGSILLGYDGMEAVASYSKITFSDAPCEIQGEDGNLVFDRMSEPSRVELRTRDGSSEVLTRPQPWHTMRYEIEAFMATAGSGAIESSINSHDVSLQTLRVTDEARRQIGIVFPADAAAN